MLAKLVDLCVRPQIGNFVFETALRTPRSEFLHGATLAASAVHDAIHKSIAHDDDSGLDTLAEERALAQNCHAALIAESQRGRKAGARDLMLEELRSQSEQLREPPVMHHTRLIVGAQRSRAADTAMMAGMHRLHCGSHLIVIDERDDGRLWRVDRQRELLLHRGCTVQCEVIFGVIKPQRYLFEAEVDGAALVDGAQEDPDISVCVADINSMTGGSFWNSATEVKWPSLVSSTIFGSGST